MDAAGRTTLSRRCPIARYSLLVLAGVLLSTPLACRGAPGVEVVESAPTTDDATTWQTYASQTYHVTLQYPAHWQPVEGYEERYGGPDGFFQVSAGFSRGLVKMDEACDQLVYHKLKPYGSFPQVKRLRVEGQEACLILPSDDQPQGMANEAALVVRYPRPVGIRGELYSYFILAADVGHIRHIAETVSFELHPAPTST